MAGTARQNAMPPGPSAAAPALQRSFGMNLLRSLRPSQWTKNLVVFAALIFGQRLFDPQSIAGTKESGKRLPTLF